LLENVERLRSGEVFIFNLMSMPLGVLRARGSELAAASRLGKKGRRPCSTDLPALVRAGRITRARAQRFERRASSSATTDELIEEHRGIRAQSRGVSFASP
jgi:hypothetical protein